MIIESAHCDDEMARLNRSVIRDHDAVRPAIVRLGKYPGPVVIQEPMLDVDIGPSGFTAYRLAANPGRGLVGPA